jgi:hypothetical protein
MQKKYAVQMNAEAPTLRAQIKLHKPMSLIFLVMNMEISKV